MMTPAPAQAPTRAPAVVAIMTADGDDNVAANDIGGPTGLWGRVVAATRSSEGASRTRQAAQAAAAVGYY